MYFRKFLRMSAFVPLLLIWRLSAAAPVVPLPLDVAAPIDPRAVSTRLVGVSSIDKSTGSVAAVGPWGKIAISRDAGKTWTQSAVPLSSDLTAVHFPSPMTGWAVGYEGVVLHSADGGNTWRSVLNGRQYGDIMVSHYEKLVKAGDAKAASALEEAKRFKKEGADKPFYDVYFESELSGWVVGAFNLILKTTDGGKTWAPWLEKTSNDEGKTLFSIGNAGKDIFIVGELGLIRRLDPNRNEFVPVNSPYAGSFFGIAGKPGVVVVFGLRGNAYRSVDSGVTWEKLSTGSSGGITSGIFLDDGSLLLVDSSGQALLSTDDGQIFSRLNIKSAMPLSGVASASKNKVVLVGDNGFRIADIAK